MNYDTMTNGYPSIGAFFGNYQITAEIACGGLGCVYQAQHAFLPRTAALKLLRPERLQSRVTRDKFLQEARLLDQLSHPHILPIYEFGIEDGLPYLAMEYAPGGSLRNLLRQRPARPLPLKKASLILSQIGKALYYAHQRGVIHRDLKPENILLRRRDDALLADFGIAIRQTTATLEQRADVSGTPAYMPPEAFRGNISRRSDQYSLACIAYELVTGRKPFTAPDTLSMAVKHLQERPAPPTRLNASLPPQVDAIILRGLEKRRVNRYPDVLAFIEELSATLLSAGLRHNHPAPTTSRQRMAQRSRPSDGPQRPASQPVNSDPNGRLPVKKKTYTLMMRPRR